MLGPSLYYTLRDHFCLRATLFRGCAARLRRIKWPVSLIQHEGFDVHYSTRLACGRTTTERDLFGPGRRRPRGVNPRRGNLHT
jgi:hypothetical protein